MFFFYDDFYLKKSHIKPRSAAVEIVGDIITSTNFVTAILPALSLSVVHTLVHTES